jgi:predicted Zn-ribbon and HTH transcriptional regulator
MKIKEVIEKLKNSIAPPCRKCPYTLGHVKFVVSPCPQCKANNYQTYHILTKNKYRGTAHC